MRVTTNRMTIAAGISLLLVGAAGCASSNQQARQQATEHWRQLRTGVTRQMAQQQLEKGQLDQAKATLREALAANPKDGQLHLLMGRVLFELRDLNAAQVEVTSARQLNPELAEADYWQGVLAQAAGLWEEAHSAYQVACNKDRQSAEYLCALLEMTLVIERSQEALDLATSRFGDFPRDARLRVLAGEACAMAGDLKRAEEFYQQAAGLDPASWEVQERLAQVLCQQSKYDQAAHVLEDAVSRSGSERSDLRLLLATCYSRGGRHDAAVKAYEMCLATMPDDAAVQGKLQEERLLAGQVDRARQELNAWLQNKPGDAHAWELLGHACVLSGELSSAEKAYQRAMECGGDSARIKEYVQAIRDRDRTASRVAPARAVAVAAAHDDMRASDEER